MVSTTSKLRIILATVPDVHEDRSGLGWIASPAALRVAAFAGMTGKVVVITGE